MKTKKTKTKKKKPRYEVRFRVDSFEGAYVFAVRDGRELTERINTALAMSALQAGRSVSIQLYKGREGHDGAAGT